ncbi:MAG: dihydrofolate reductase [Owenweeksia sp.]|nr:dihydrofolate reductase [Owenweeksia sp.]
MNLTLIAAMSQNRVIGANNDLIWHLPKDLKHFKGLTKGHHVIMGRKTFESMGKALPHRTNIVVTNRKDYPAPGCIVVHSLREAIQKAENDSQPYIIGGGKIYEQALPFADTLELTIVHAQLEGDTYFPELDESLWQVTEKTTHQADDAHEYAFDFLTYHRKSS